MLAFAAPQRTGYDRTDGQIGEFRREILGQFGISNEWFDRRFNLPSFQFLPVNLSEEAVTLDALHVLRHASAQPFLRLLTEKASEKVFCVRAQEVGQDQFCLHNLFPDLHVGVGAEGG